MNREFTISDGAKLTMHPNNAISPLESVYRGRVFSSKDHTESVMDAFNYAITVGWDDESYKDLKLKFKWVDQDIQAMKELREKFIELENKSWR